MLVYIAVLSQRPAVLANQMVVMGMSLVDRQLVGQGCQVHLICHFQLHFYIYHFECYVWLNTLDLLI